MSTTSGPSAGAPLVFATLGAALVTSGNPTGEQRTLNAGKPLALMTYLAFAPGRNAARDVLLDLLWSDVDRDSGLHALRQTIWYIRKRFGESSIVATREKVRLGVELEADHDEFLDAIARQDHERAIAMYAGDFLPGIALPGAAQFELWAELERQRLRSMFVRAAHTVIRSWLSTARHRDAVALARRLKELDQSESNWRLLLECLIASRDRVAAVLEADAFCAFMAREEQEPDPATHALLRIIG